MTDGTDSFGREMLAKCAPRAARCMPVDVAELVAGFGHAGRAPPQRHTCFRIASAMKGSVCPLAVPKFWIAEVAELFAVSDGTVRGWIDSRRLPAECDKSRRPLIAGIRRRSKSAGGMSIELR